MAVTDTAVDLTTIPLKKCDQS